MKRIILAALLVAGLATQAFAYGSVTVGGPYFGVSVSSGYPVAPPPPPPPAAYGYYYPAPYYAPAPPPPAYGYYGYWRPHHRHYPPRW